MCYAKHVTLVTSYAVSLNWYNSHCRLCSFSFSSVNTGCF